jgi:hypothetical protein
MLEGKKIKIKIPIGGKIGGKNWGKIVKKMFG